MIFIWVINMLGFLPLPLTGEKWHGVPTWGIYAATSSLSVTLALALLTFVFTHVEGVRWNGQVRYFKSWIPEAPPALLALIVPLEVLGQFMRLISLSVRLFANMLAGHILILTFIGLMFILESVYLAVVVIPVGTIFYIFEVGIVVTIQAFIFAALSAIYIVSAMIQSVARQPELRGELQGIQWLGFALTEAVVFYGLLGSILAYVLV